MIRGRALGDYERTPVPWGSIFYSYGQYLPAQEMGLGCAACQHKGVGLFDSGFDVSGWGFAEWAVLGLSVYLAASLFRDTRRTVRGIRAASKKRSVRRERRKSLRKQLRAAGGFGF